MELSKKLKIFSQLVTAFLKASLDFKHFQKNFECHSFRLSEIIDCEMRAQVNF